MLRCQFYIPRTCDIEVELDVAKAAQEKLWSDGSPLDGLLTGISVALFDASKAGCLIISFIFLLFFITI